MTGGMEIEEKAGQMDKENEYFIFSFLLSFFMSIFAILHLKEIMFLKLVIASFSPLLHLLLTSLLLLLLTH